MLTPPERFYVLGDEHALFWGGLYARPAEFPIQRIMQITSQGRALRNSEPFEIYVLNPAQISPIAVFTVQTVRLLMDIIHTLPVRSWVILSFGEYECRCQFAAVDDWQSRVDLVVSYYCRLIEMIEERGHHVVVWGPPATTLLDDPPDHFRPVGTPMTRNVITYYFTSQLVTAGLNVVSLFSQMLDAAGNTDPHALRDGFYVRRDFFSLAYTALKAVVSEIAELKGSVNHD